VRVEGKTNERLRSWWMDSDSRAVVFVESELLLETANKRPLTVDFLQEQWGRLGGTIFELSSVQLDTQDAVIIPMSELNRMRREAADRLLEARRQPPKYILRESNRGESQPSSSRGIPIQAQQSTPQLTVLCRQIEQVRAVTERTDVQWIYADFEFVKQYPEAVEIVHAAGKHIALATPRIHMPGENRLLRRLLELKPDALLVRNTGALYFYLRELSERTTNERPRLIGDFSLNIANHLTAELFHEAGCDQLTPSYDLNIQQMIDLLRNADTSLLEVVIHQHMPMFHTEHCVYCTFLSDGTDYTNCGRPCEQHQVSLQDRVGMSHPVRVDEGCRNTVYNAIEQSGAEYLQQFCELGVASLRIEFLEENTEQVCQVISLYEQAIAGKVSGSHVWRTLKATNQLGVTRGQLIK